MLIEKFKNIDFFRKTNSNPSVNWNSWLPQLMKILIGLYQRITKQLPMFLTVGVSAVRSIYGYWEAFPFIYYSDDFFSPFLISCFLPLVSGAGLGGGERYTSCTSCGFRKCLRTSFCACARRYDGLL